MRFDRCMPRQRRVWIAHDVADLLARHWPSWAMTPSVCIALISRLDPCFMPVDTRTQWARRCVRQAARIIGRRRHPVLLSQADAQALWLYRRGLDAAMSRIESWRCWDPVEALASSPWTTGQLHKMALLGYQHGIFVRYATQQADASDFGQGRGRAVGQEWGVNA